MLADGPPRLVLPLAPGAGQGRAVRAEVLRLKGDPHSAAEVLERTRWQAIESPELIQVRLKVYADLEDTASAAVWEQMARIRYGENHLVQDGLSYLESSRL